VSDPGFLTDDISTRLRVLIADDIQETRRNTRLMLAMNPEVEVVAIARNGRQAVSLAEKFSPDLAILDINMPDMDGLSAFEAMKESNPNIACIIISAEKDNETFRRAMSVGAREFLMKPFTVDELNLAVHKVSQLVIMNRRDTLQISDVTERSEADLERLAVEYTKNRRVDDQALQVFEQLASNPKCELRWLRILAMVYVIRQDWSKLKGLAERLHLRTVIE
jgi:YesN/AraC family two-component response regulator